MIMDGALLFDSGSAITTGGASANTIDLLNFRDMGIGDPGLKVQTNVGTALAGGTSVNFQLQGSVDNVNWFTIEETGAVVTANLSAASKITLNWSSLDTNQPTPRYIRMNYVVVGTYTAGTLTSFVVVDRDDEHYYPPGIVIAN